MFWFDYARGMVKNHVVSTNYHEFPAKFRKEEYKGRSMLVKKLNMLPVECIVRESQKFETLLFTSSIKGDMGQHDEKGELILGDEILTPDSSRFWPLDKYEAGRGQDSFDK